MLTAGAGRVAPEIAERVIGHKVEIIEEIYNRHDYEAEIGEALRKLEAAIRPIIAPQPSKVVSFPARA